MGRFILRKARPRKDGRVSLTFSGYVGGHRVYAGTGLTVKPSDWDDIRQQVRRTDPNYVQLNAKLREYQARFDREVAGLAVVDEAAVDRLRHDLSRKSAQTTTEHQDRTLTFWSGFDLFLAAKATDRGERTIAKYRTLHTVLTEFERTFGKITFASLSHDFYDDFKQYLITKRKLTNNTIGKYVSTLKTYLSWADDRGADLPRDYRKFKVDEEGVEVVALTWDELERLERLDVQEMPRLDRVKDLFLFACYTGARFGDVQHLHFDDVRGSVWSLRMTKTRSETRIHLIPKAMSILTKYRAEGRLPKISSQRMNDYLKELGQRAEIIEPVRIVRYMGATRVEERGPKWQFLSSHVARRTFVTLSLERGMRPELLMSLTGHRSFKTMKKYIALTENSRAEAMQTVWGE